MNKELIKNAAAKVIGTAEQTWGAAIDGKERRVTSMMRSAAPGPFFYADEDMTEREPRARRKIKSHHPTRLADASVLCVGLIALVELLQLFRLMLV